MPNMNSNASPKTTTFTYYDVFSNEWVTTFTIRHKSNLEEQPKKESLDEDIKNFIEEAKMKFNKDSVYKLPTLNDIMKPISYF